MRLLDAALGQVIGFVKKYPRVLVLADGMLLCLKVDDFDFCSLKWMKKLSSVRQVERIPKQALTSGWSIIIQCEEIDRETGERFQEVIGFNKENEMEKFLRSLAAARKVAASASASAKEDQADWERAETLASDGVRSAQGGSGGAPRTSADHDRWGGQSDAVFSDRMAPAPAPTSPAQAAAAPARPTAPVRSNTFTGPAASSAAPPARLVVAVPSLGAIPSAGAAPPMRDLLDFDSPKAVAPAEAQRKSADMFASWEGQGGGGAAPFFSPQQPAHAGMFRGSPPQYTAAGGFPPPAGGLFAAPAGPAFGVGGMPMGGPRQQPNFPMGPSAPPAPPTFPPPQQQVNQRAATSAFPSTGGGFDIFSGPASSTGGAGIGGPPSAGKHPSAVSGMDFFTQPVQAPSTHGLDNMSPLVAAMPPPPVEVAQAPAAGGGFHHYPGAPLRAATFTAGSPGKPKLGEVKKKAADPFAALVGV